MFKAIMFLTLAAGLSSIANAYPAGCQTDREGAFVQTGADSKERIIFSSMAVCTEQMALLKAQPHAVVCGCHNSTGMMSLMSMFVGNYAIQKDVSCFRVNYGLGSATLEPVKVKNSHWPQFYTLRDLTKKKQPTPDEEVAKACVKDETKFFQALNNNSSSREIVEADIPASAAN